MTSASKVAEKAQTHTETAKDGKRTRVRSPAYPFLSLDAALKRAKLFYDAEQRNAAPLKVAAKHWGYEEKSSGAAQTAATLISFGLMEDEGTGEKRKLRLSKRALRILLDERPMSPERDNLIKEAALAPKIHQELWKRWGANLPSTDSLKHTLMFDWQPPFNPASVDGFIKEYRGTIALANLSESDMLSADAEDTSELGGEGLQEERIDVSERNSPLPPSGKRSNMSEEVFSVPEGKVVMHWPTPLSTTSIEDLQDWLDIIKRKIGRSKPQPESQDQAS